MDADSLEDILHNVFLKYDMSLTLKSQQREVLLSLLHKKHTMAFLPTGFGKSLTFTLLPLILDEVSQLYLSYGKDVIIINMISMTITMSLS